MIEILQGASMRFKCPACGKVMNVDGTAPPSSCVNCQTRFKIPARSKPASKPKPIVEPVAGTDSFDFFGDDSPPRDDRKQAIRTTRQEKSVKARNPIGLAGFALNALTLVVLIVLWRFALRLDELLLPVIIAAILIVLAGVGISIWGIVLKGRQKIFAILGVVLTPFLLVMIVILYAIYDFTRF